MRVGRLLSDITEVAFDDRSCRRCAAYPQDRELGCPAESTQPRLPIHPMSRAGWEGVAVVAWSFFVDAGGHLLPGLQTPQRNYAVRSLSFPRESRWSTVCGCRAQDGHFMGIASSVTSQTLFRCQSSSFDLDTADRDEPAAARWISVSRETAKSAALRCTPASAPWFHVNTFPCLTGLAVAQSVTSRDLWTPHRRLPAGLRPRRGH
jgi:hypothetical protein